MGEEKPQGLSCATSSKSKETTPWVIRRFSGWWQGDPSVDVSSSFLFLSFQGEVEDVKRVLDITRNTQSCKAWLVRVWVNLRHGKGGENFPHEAFATSPRSQIPSLQQSYLILAPNSHGNRWRTLRSALTILCFWNKTTLVSTLFYHSTSSWSLN